jgi:hypothetical protein
VLPSVTPDCPEGADAVAVDAVAAAVDGWQRVRLGPTGQGWMEAVATAALSPRITDISSSSTVRYNPKELFYRYHRYR